MAHHVFVRPATGLDARTIGAIHAETMQAALAAALGSALPPHVNELFVPDAFARQWEQAIAEPPSRDHAVLSAIDEGTVVGFAALSPTQRQALPGSEAEEEAQGDAVVAEITALEVPTSHGRAGHGSRLLAAATDLAREHGATAVQMWVLAGDDAHTSFLHGAGFAPTGLHRTMEVGEQSVTEHCWYAILPSTEQDYGNLPV